MARDSLRSTLDDLKLDPASAKDRPYLEAMLRRLGYTEKEIRAELGPPPAAEPARPARSTAVPAPDALDQDFGGDSGAVVGRTALVPLAGDALGPAREYRLVIPSQDAFSYADPNAVAGGDAPFEQFEQVEFQEAAVAETPVPSEEMIDFIEEHPEAQARRLAELERQRLAEEADAAERAARAARAEAERLTAAEETIDFIEEDPSDAAEAQALAAAEAAAARRGRTGAFGEGSGVEDVPLDTFGSGDVDTKPRTRVRVKRVRAKSTQEAEAKVAKSNANRKVIKSIPVDIVERWGPSDKEDQK